MSFDPLSLFGSGEQGVIYDVSDLSSMFQDSAGTTPAVVDSPVGKLNDLSANANHALQATANNRPILRHDYSGYYLESDGSNDDIRATFAISQPITRASLITQNAWGDVNAVYSAANFNGSLYQTGGTPELRLYSGSYAAMQTKAYLKYRSLISEVFNGASSSLMVNRQTASTGNPGAGNPNGLVLFGDTSAGDESAIRLYRLVEINRTLTATELEDVHYWLTNEWTRVLVIDGDSNTAAQTLDGYGWQFLPNASPGVFLQNIAVAGTGLDTNSPGDLAFRTAAIDAYLPVDKRGRLYIYFPWWSNNTPGAPHVSEPLGGGTGAAGYAARVATFLAARKAAGWDKVGIGTIIERTDAGQDNTGTRLAYNAIIRDPAWLAANGVDFLVDFANEPVIGAVGASTNVAIMNADLAHLLTAGHTYAEVVFRASINGLSLFNPAWARGSNQIM